VNAWEQYDARGAGSGAGAAWWFQSAVCLLVAATPAAGALVYLRAADPAAVSLLLLLGGVGAWMIRVRHQPASRAFAALGVCALVGAIGLIVLVGRVLDREKNMAPFMAAMNAELPPREPIYALGADETVEAIVPFVTDRTVIAIDYEQLMALGNDALPDAVLVQTKGDDDSPPGLNRRYARSASGQFGPGREMTLWRRCAGACQGGEDAAAPN
jgi:hypothetical protein